MPFVLQYLLLWTWKKIHRKLLYRLLTFGKYQIIFVSFYFRDLVLDEKCVMNSYFGIGIDAKITLDFHMKREEHPEKCRSRARNRMWYGVLGGKELLQKSYKNLEQRVLLECDGTRIPLPSLQGIVVLNITSFMGGANFWGGHKEDDCFIAPSFDDRFVFSLFSFSIYTNFTLRQSHFSNVEIIRLRLSGVSESIF